MFPQELLEPHQPLPPVNFSTRTETSARTLETFSDSWNQLKDHRNPLQGLDVNTQTWGSVCEHETVRVKLHPDSQQFAHVVTLRELTADCLTHWRHQRIHKHSRIKLFHTHRALALALSGRGSLLSGFIPPDPGRDAAATWRFSVGSPGDSRRYKQTEDMWADAGAPPSASGRSLRRLQVLLGNSDSQVHVGRV